ncbi:MAG: prefoldin subunit beta [Nanoarchaeota archaeon]|nr:prefoldin subunit beta [Nanoarchaeota archaeon]
MEVSNDAKDDILKFQQIQQQLQLIMVQKQDLQAQKAEVENAIKELGKIKNEDAYEVIGNIMIKKSKKELEDSLKNKKELIELRLSTIEKQQEKLTKDASKLQEKLAKQIK